MQRLYVSCKNSDGNRSKQKYHSIEKELAQDHIFYPNVLVMTNSVQMIQNM